MFFKKTTLSAFLTIAGLCSSPYSLAETLEQLYRMAIISDPSYLQARESYLSQSEDVYQAMASLGPQVNLEVTTTGNSSSRQDFGRYNQHNYDLSLSLPIINWTSIVSIVQSQVETKQAKATFLSAEQTLVFRLVESYFNILNAYEELMFRRKQRQAFSRHLEQTKHRFDVGLIAITDVHVAQARHDNAYAQEILAENNLRNEFESLVEIVGEPVTRIKGLNEEVLLPKPSPNNIDTWVDAARENNLDLKAAEFSMKSIELSVDTSKTAYFPTLSLDVDLVANNGVPPTFISSHSRSFELNFSLPIFTSGDTSSKIRQAIHNYHAQRQSYIQTLRDIESETRQTFRSVHSTLSEIQALYQSVISSQSALDATESAFEAGTRTIVDVLNSQTDLLNSKKSYANARNQYIVQSIRLKQLAGSLSPEDVLELNGLLQFNTILAEMNDVTELEKINKEPPTAKSRTTPRSIEDHSKKSQ